MVVGVVGPFFFPHESATPHHAHVDAHAHAPPHNPSFYPPPPPQKSANPGTCASYIQCYNAGAAGVVQACPSGLVFNPTPKYCDWPYNYACPSR